MHQYREYSQNGIFQRIVSEKAILQNTIDYSEYHCSSFLPIKCGSKIAGAYEVFGKRESQENMLLQKSICSPESEIL